MKNIVLLLIVSAFGFIGAGCSIEELLAPIGEVGAALPIKNGYQVNNVSSYLEAEAWLNGSADFKKADIGPKKSARFGIGTGDGGYTYATLTVTVNNPAERDVTVYQVERQFRARYERVYAVTVEDFEGGPAVFVHEGNGKIAVPPVR